MASKIRGRTRGPQQEQQLYPIPTPPGIHFYRIMFNDQHSREKGHNNNNNPRIIGFFYSPAFQLRFFNLLFFSFRCQRYHIQRKGGKKEREKSREESKKFMAMDKPKMSQSLFSAHNHFASLLVCASQYENAMLKNALTVQCTSKCAIHVL